MKNFPGVRGMGIWANKRAAWKMLNDGRHHVVPEFPQATMHSVGRVRNKMASLCLLSSLSKPLVSFFLSVEHSYWDILFIPPEVLVIECNQVRLANTLVSKVHVKGFSQQKPALE